MTTFRENLIDRMIRIYGFEHEITLQFARFCESEIATDKVLEDIVRIHEDKPLAE